MGEIFISYSRHDQEFTDSLIHGLEQSGLQVWVDRENIEAGELWRAAISRAIAECDAFLVLLSPNCVASKNVVKELSMAESRDRHIVPLMYQECEIPPEMDYQLAGLQWVHFTQMSFEEALDRLVRTLRGGQGSPAPKAAPPQKPAPPPVSAAQPGYPSMNPPPMNLPQILCGRWDIQFGSSYTGVGGRVMVDIYPNGSFSGQVMAPVGVSQINGQWQFTGPAQVVFQGQQTMGWFTNPYVTMVQFNQVSPGALSGMTAAGEQVFWRKIG